MMTITTQWQTLVDDLTAQREKIIDDIRNYPPPIPACDAQFNYMLEKRDRLTVELHRLQKLESDLSSESLLDFVNHSAFVRELD